jgi:N-acetylmuramic acid 6-phosphate (MurNAc-6-P) etherase
MVDLNPSNTKLRDRAVRILQALTNKEAAVCQQTLVECSWNVKNAWMRLSGKSRERS